VELVGLLSLLRKLEKKDIARAVVILSKLVLKERRVLAWSAAVSLGYIDEPSSVPRLINAATKGVSRENRRAAISALGVLGDRRAAAILVRVLRDRHEAADIRSEAAEALASCGGNSIRAVEALTTASSDRSERVRLSSASSLRIIGNRRD